MSGIVLRAAGISIACSTIVRSGASGVSSDREIESGWQMITVPGKITKLGDAFRNPQQRQHRLMLVRADRVLDDVDVQDLRRERVRLPLEIALELLPSVRRAELVRRRRRMLEHEVTELVRDAEPARTRIRDPIRDVDDRAAPVLNELRLRAVEPRFGDPRSSPPRRERHTAARSRYHRSNRERRLLGSRRRLVACVAGVQRLEDGDTRDRGERDAAEIGRIWIALNAWPCAHANELALVPGTGVGVDEPATSSQSRPTSLASNSRLANMPTPSDATAAAPIDQAT